MFYKIIPVSNSSDVSAVIVQKLLLDNKRIWGSFKGLILFINNMKNSGPKFQHIYTCDKNLKQNV